ncbi:MAG TPA: amidase [Actinomycetota bacterium]
MGELRDLAERIASGETTSLAEVGRTVETMDHANHAINLFTVIMREEAIAAAIEADAGPARGPLHGVPVAVKDLFDVAGRPTTACSGIYAGRIAATDAPVVAALRRAGAIIVGKTNMHELAFGATGDVSSIGPADNPWNPSRMTGGSSSGSAAAVAAGLVPLALGTDTGGSVRIPSSLCGVSGLKTTNGLLSVEGAVPLSPTLDTVGPIAGDAEDLALAMQVLSGLSVVWLDDLSGVTVGMAQNRSFDTIDPLVERGVRAAAGVLESAGARIVDIALPDAERVRDTWADIVLPEFLRAHPGMDTSLLSEELQFLAAAARTIEPRDERDARDAMSEHARRWDAAFESVDVIALPTTPVGAPLHFATTARIGGDDVPVHGGLLSSKTRQINVAEIPAISIPCGFDENLMPFGLQLAGPRGSEARLLAVAAVFQSRTDWHRRRPAQAWV